MIFVVGTKRSGTSMWMQALVAAGFPTIGSAFPQNWKETLAVHNPRGFFESLFREGVNHETNPHPRLGHFLFPDQVTRHVVKVFPAGLVRSDYGYIDHVVATMRDWRSYDVSVRKLIADDRPDLVAPILPPWLEWWLENYGLVRDVAIRKHSIVLNSYDAVLRDPEAVVGRVVRHLGGANVQAAVAAIDKELNRSSPDPAESPPDDIVAVLDALYESIDQRREVSAPLIRLMNATHMRIVQEFRPVIEAASATPRPPPASG